MPRLHLINSFDGWTVLAKESYLRTDSVFEVPLEMLTQATRRDGLPLELKQCSFDIVRRFMRHEREVKDVEELEIDVS
jgi:hypothetical protein